MLTSLCCMCMCMCMHAVCTRMCVCMSKSGTELGTDPVGSLLVAIHSRGASAPAGILPRCRWEVQSVQVPGAGDVWGQLEWKVGVM